MYNLLSSSDFEMHLKAQILNLKFLQNDLEKKDYLKHPLLKMGTDIRLRLMKHPLSRMGTDIQLRLMKHPLSKMGTDIQLRLMKHPLSKMGTDIRLRLMKCPLSKMGTDIRLYDFRLCTEFRKFLADLPGINRIHPP